MQKKLKGLKPSYLISVGVFFAFSLLWLGVQKMNAEHTIKKERQYYHEQIKAVSHNVEAIQKIIDDPYALADQKVLPLYEQQLDAIIERCHNVIRRKDNKPEKLAAISPHATGQCRKLIGLVAYQKNLYDQFKLILQIEPKRLPDTVRPDFVARMSEIELLIRQTYSNVSLINNPDYDDQYKKEIENNLAILQRKAFELQASRSRESLKTFIASLEQMQNELLIYRSSYWHNAVVIESLRTEIDKSL